MRSVHLHADVPDRSAAESFALLRRMQDYPRYSPAVVDLRVDRQSEDSSVSWWKVKFGPGTAEWSQQDTFDAAQSSIRFKRLAGDIEDFTGAWTINETSHGCQVKFDAEFDSGLFLLAGVVEPMIQDLLRENIGSILKGLFPSSELVLS